jgi:competence protein ComEC
VGGLLFGFGLYGDSMSKEELKRRLRKVFNNTVLAVLLLAGAAVGLAIVSRPDGRLHIYFCDVGQGDAILIKTPQNRQILVDGGRDDQVLNCLSQALPFYDHDLDLVILTHPHADHVGGLIDVLRTYQVGKVVFQQTPYKSADYQEFIDLLGEKNLSTFKVVAGETLALDQQTRAEVWYPLSQEELELLDASIDPYDGEDVNDSSIVFRLVCGNFETILTGDAPEQVQKLLLQRGMVKEADVLKVGHQGAKDGSDEDFLKKVNPDLAVISVGENNTYGHPHQETLEEIKNAGVELKRTDQDGTIEVVSDCRTWWVE